MHRSHQRSTGAEGRLRIADSTATGAIINLTPHPIRVIRPDGEIVYPPADRPVRVAQTATRVNTIERVPVYDLCSGGLIDSPPPRPGTSYIVSTQVASRAERADFLVPHDLLRDEHGRVIACRSFARVTRD